MALIIVTLKKSRLVVYSVTLESKCIEYALPQTIAECVFAFLVPNKKKLSLYDHSFGVFLASLIIVNLFITVDK